MDYPDSARHGIALDFIAEWAKAVCYQDVLRIIEDSVTTLDTAGTVDFDEYMGRVRFASPDVIAVNSISVAHAFMLYLRVPGCFLRQSVPLLSIW